MSKACFGQFPGRGGVPAPLDGAGDDAIEIREDEAIVTYLLCDTAMIIFVKTMDSSLFSMQNLNGDFWISLHDFRNKLTTADPLGLSRQGKILYLFLIQPIEKMIIGKRRLIITPDDEITGIPFEALIRIDEHLSSRGSASYLVFDFEIEYRICPDHIEPGPDETYHEGCTGDENKMFAFMGFSPVFSDHPLLTSLPGSKVEVSEIARLFREKGLTSWLVSDQYSSKKNFLDAASSGKILHLATHSASIVTENDTPGFLFWDFNPAKAGEGVKEGILTTDDIRGLNLRADLVVLNACSSGVRFESGSGKISLTEMFLFAGARNILSTLWNITDQVAVMFMIDFYRCFLSGKTFSEALRTVKVKMLSKPETSLPTVWAPYVLTSR